MHLMDHTGEIRAIAVKHLADKFDCLEVDGVYRITKCELRTATKCDTKIENECEMVFTDETFIEAAEEYDMSYYFERIADIIHRRVAIRKPVDIAGICKDIGDLQSVKFEDGRTRLLRNIILCSTNSEITVKFWDLDAKYFKDSWYRATITVMRAKIREDNGAMNLSMEEGSFFEINPVFDQEMNSILAW